jgi:hypothetical protein
MDPLAALVVELGARAKAAESGCMARDKHIEAQDKEIADLKEKLAKFEPKPKEEKEKGKTAETK